VPQRSAVGLLRKPLLGLHGPQIVELACVVVAQDWRPEALPTR
jgi:hypothetical protein